MIDDIVEAASRERDTGDHDELTVVNWWRRLATDRDREIAVLEAGEGVSFGDLDRRSADLAWALLDAGYGKGSRIALLMGNSADWIAAWLATQRIGALAVFVSSFFAEQELRHALRHADAQLLLLDPAYLHHDYLARMETAFPDLAAHEGSGSLLIDEAPYLRAVWTSKPAARAWVATDFASAARTGQRVAARAPALLDRIAAEIHPADASAIIYTSGSTAHPKAVIHRQEVVADKIRFLAGNNAIIPADTEAGDRVLVTMPLFWVGGFLSCFGALERGASVAFSPALPAPRLWDEIETIGATHVTGPDATLRSLQDHIGPGRRLADRLKPQNSNQMAWFRGEQGYDPDSIGSAFGMTETMGPHSGFRSIDDTYGMQAGSLGGALGRMERRIADPVTEEDVAPGTEGELRVRGPWLMEGYYKQQRGTGLDDRGYFRTGDRCIIDDANRLHFVGRDSGMIKTSGANVAPEEVENALRQCDEVIEAVVIGMPDPVRGQLVVAFVAPRPGAALDADMLRDWLRPRVSSFKIPRRFLFMPFDDMPRTASNKIHRGALAEIAEARARTDDGIPTN
jgi:acyl-coenzyme A synthetase/AMP-(fatty) acid ligase